MREIRIKSRPVVSMEWEEHVRTTTSPWRLKEPSEQWASNSAFWHKYDQLVCQKTSTSLLKPVQVELPLQNGDKWRGLVQETLSSASARIQTDQTGRVLSFCLELYGKHSPMKWQECWRRAPRRKNLKQTSQPSSMGNEHVKYISLLWPSKTILRGPK